MNDNGPRWRRWSPFARHDAKDQRDWHLSAGNDEPWKPVVGEVRQADGSDHHAKRTRECERKSYSHFSADQQKSEAGAAEKKQGCLNEGVRAPKPFVIDEVQEFRRENF